MVKILKSLKWNLKQTLKSWSHDKPLYGVYILYYICISVCTNIIILNIYIYMYDIYIYIHIIICINTHIYIYLTCTHIHIFIYIYIYIYIYWGLPKRVDPKTIGFPTVSEIIKFRWFWAFLNSGIPLISMYMIRGMSIGWLVGRQIDTEPPYFSWLLKQ